LLSPPYYNQPLPTSTTLRRLPHTHHPPTNTNAHYRCLRTAYELLADLLTITNQRPPTTASCHQDVTTVATTTSANLDPPLFCLYPTTTGIASLPVTSSSYLTKFLRTCLCFSYAFVFHFFFSSCASFFFIATPLLSLSFSLSLFIFLSLSLSFSFFLSGVISSFLFFLFSLLFFLFFSFLVFSLSLFFFFLYLVYFCVLLF
jgi:hypothetical protein